MNNNKLPGDYIAGFVDGEGCFALNFRRDIRHERGKRSKLKPTYFYWKAQFVISLRSDDNELLQKIKNTLNCGQISFSRNNARYQISNLNDLKDIIIPFFLKHRLYGKKNKDFYLWKEAIGILVKYKEQRASINRKPGGSGFYKITWERQDLRKLSEIRNNMSSYKADRHGKALKWADTKDIGRAGNE